MSGKDFNRPRYQAMLLMLREGDLLYLDALDRLGRNYDGIIDQWKYITRDIKADIVCLDNEILFDSRKFRNMGDFGKVMEDQFLSLLAYVAEQDRKNNRKRQSEGIAVAKAAGKTFSRPKKAITPAFNQVYDEWKSGQLTAVAAMKRLNMKQRTFYRRVSDFENQNLHIETATRFN